MSEFVIMSSEATTVDGDNATNIVDVDKLLVSVQNQPAIYNTALKDQHNFDVINKVWTEMGKDLSASGKLAFYTG